MNGSILFLVFVIALILAIGALIYYRKPCVREITQGDFDDAAHELREITDQYRAGCLTTLELVEAVGRHREVVVAATHAGFRDPNTGLVSSLRRVA